MKRTVAIVLGVLGMTLIVAPLAAPIAFTLLRALSGAPGVNFDFLMPAELAPAALSGAALLLIAALVAKRRRMLVGIGVASAVIGLVGGLWAAVLTGLADGSREAVGWPVWLVGGGLGIYVLALLALAIAGGLLLADLRRAKTQLADDAPGPGPAG